MVGELEQAIESTCSSEPIIIRNFGTSPERITSGYLNLLGIYLLTKNSLSQVFNLASPEIFLDGNANLDQNVRFCHSGKPDIENPCNLNYSEALKKIKINVKWPTGTLDQYRFLEQETYNKFDEESGENIVYSFLVENSRPSLMSLQYLAYEVDHSGDDYPIRVIRRTELLNSESDVARFVFDEIKELKKRGEF